MQIQSIVITGHHKIIWSKTHLMSVFIVNACLCKLSVLFKCKRNPFFFFYKRNIWLQIRLNRLCLPHPTGQPGPVGSLVLRSVGYLTATWTIFCVSLVWLFYVTSHLHTQRETKDRHQKTQKSQSLTETKCDKVNPTFQFVPQANSGYMRTFLGTRALQL